MEKKYRISKDTDNNNIVVRNPGGTIIGIFTVLDDMPVKEQRANAKIFADALNQQQEPRDESFAGFNLNDIMEEAERNDEEITEDEAREVLKRVAKNADMEQGVNWYFISGYIDEVIAERVNGLKMEDESEDEESDDDIEEGFWRREAGLEGG